MSSVNGFISFGVGDFEYRTDVGSNGYFINHHPHHRFGFVEHGNFPFGVIVQDNDFSHVLDFFDSVFACA